MCRALSLWRASRNTCSTVLGGLAQLMQRWWQPESQWRQQLSKEAARSTVWLGLLRPAVREWDVRGARCCSEREWDVRGARCCSDVQAVLHVAAGGVHGLGAADAAVLDERGGLSALLLRFAPPWPPRCARKVSISLPTDVDGDSFAALAQPSCARVVNSHTPYVQGRVRCPLAAWLRPWPFGFARPSPPTMHCSPRAD